MTRTGNDYQENPLTCRDILQGKYTMFTNLIETRKQVLPYKFTTDLFGKHVTIENTKGEKMTLDRDQITHQLNRTDLDPHRRRMYEAARDELRKAARS